MREIQKQSLYAGPRTKRDDLSSEQLSARYDYGRTRIIDPAPARQLARQEVDIAERRGPSLHVACHYVTDHFQAHDGIPQAQPGLRTDKTGFPTAWLRRIAVSYTHLTLPTKRIV